MAMKATETEKCAMELHTPGGGARTAAEKKMISEVVSSGSIRRTKTSQRDSKLYRLVNSAAFDMTLGIAIVLNAIVIGAEVEFKSMPEDERLIFSGFQFIFFIVFTAELVLRVGAAGLNSYVFGRERYWNYLDVAMVIISVGEVANTVVSQGKNTKKGGAILRIVRMARLIRIVRVLRFSPQLRMLLFMIFESVKSLLWLLLTLVVILYIFSICFTMAATDYLTVPDDAPPPVHGKEIARYFGTIPRSVYSCFKSMTGGQNWGEMLDPLMDVHVMYGLLFLAYVAFAVLALLNVVTGVFVDGALAKSSNDRDFVVEREMNQKKAYVENLKELFLESDDDMSGQLSYEEFLAHMRNPKVEAYLNYLNIDTTDITGLFNALDDDESGSISVDEFIANLIVLMRGQTLEQVVQKLGNQMRLLMRHVCRFSDFTAEQFALVRASAAGQAQTSVLKEKLQKMVSEH